jgi:hypothetical protein
MLIKVGLQVPCNLALLFTIAIIHTNIKTINKNNVTPIKIEWASGKRNWAERKVSFSSFVFPFFSFLLQFENRKFKFGFGSNSD